jgi:hypothetical protein
VDFSRSANRRQEFIFPWAFPARSFMGLGTILVTSMARGIMLLDIIGGLTVIHTTGVPIGGTGTGGVTAGTGIERIRPEPC